MQLKDEMSIASADQINERSDSKARFKALRFKKKIFEQMDRLPEVEKRRQTDFSEF